MEKLAMCRICLVQDVRMYVVVNKNLQELYEKLTGVPFVTEDRRPMLTCFFCCTKLKQCCRFLRKCLEAEQLFAQMLSEEYERDPKINLEHLEFFNGFSNSPIVHVSIVDGSQTDSVAIKEELPAASECLDDIIDLEEENQTDELDLDNVHSSCPDVEDTPALHAELDSEDVPLMEIKIKVEEYQESIGAPVVTKPKLDTRRPTLVDTISTKQKKNENNRKLRVSRISKVIKKTLNHTSKRMIKLKEPVTKTRHGVNRLDTRRPTLVDTISTKQKKNENNRKLRVSRNSKVIKKTLNHTSKRMIKLKEPVTKTQHGVNSTMNNTVLGTSCRNNSNKDDIKKCKLSKKSVDSDDINRYRRVCVKEKSFKCYICQRSFTYKSDLETHIRTHTGEKPFKCDIFLRSFTRKSSLVMHIGTHTGKKPFKCDICQRSFSQKRTLVIHIRTHTGEKPHKCYICQHSFTQKSDLTKHTRTHTGEKPFKCEICQRSFRRKPTLVVHIRTHTGEKPFKCDICQLSCSDKYSLVVHVRTHTGEKPFKCEICQRSFNRKPTLTNHIRLHTGEKPFKCDICQRSFTSKRVLVRHTAIHTR